MDDGCPPSVINGWPSNNQTGIASALGNVNGLTWDELSNWKKQETREGLLLLYPVFILFNQTLL